MVAVVQVLHVRFEGRSVEIPLSDLDVGQASTDQQVRQAVADYLNVAVDRLRFYVIDRHESGNLTLRPEAVFG